MNFLLYDFVGRDLVVGETKHENGKSINEKFKLSSAQPRVLLFEAIKYLSGLFLSGLKTSPRESSSSAESEVVFISAVEKILLLNWGYFYGFSTFFPLPTRKGGERKIYSFRNESEETACESAAEEGENRNRIMLFMPIQGKVNYSRPRRLEINNNNFSSALCRSPPSSFDALFTPHAQRLVPLSTSFPPSLAS